MIPPSRSVLPLHLPTTFCTKEPIIPKAKSTRFCTRQTPSLGIRQKIIQPEIAYSRIYKQLTHFYGVTGVSQDCPAHGTLGELVWTSMTDGEWFGPGQQFWNVRVNDDGRSFRDRVKTRNWRRPFHNIHASIEGESPQFDRLIDMAFKPPFGI